jgi:NAD(P)-dependent dehydrogenase (short-subunit alcohol dehydrogenase family)/acyl dehydratase/putative sterol carrier protein
MALFDGKVAIITGAGNGIGRCHALQFAKLGAKVVVNDLGGARDGEGTSARAADTVVEEIQAAGGEAVANYASVADPEGAQSIIQSALDAWGRADFLVNNAGILRDKTLLKLDEANWDIVIAVHLKGTYLCSKVFAAHVKERADAGDLGGRIVNTSSYAGLIGNFGQSNYGAAKAGIAGLTRVWAQELGRSGVTVNAIAPMAKTRMTDDIAMVPDEMTPEQISPLVLYLCSDMASEISGQVFGIHGQQLFEYKMVMTEGATKGGKELWTVDEIANDIEKICALAKAPAPAAAAPAAPAGPEEIIAQAFSLMPEVFLPERAKGWNANIQFKIDGASDWSLIVADGTCKSAKGLEGTATCTVKVKAETWADIVTGKEKAEKAFMSGKITASNLGDMMKLGGAFDMKKAAELAKKAGSASSAPAAPAAKEKPKGMNKDMIGQKFGGGHQWVEKEHTMAYAQATNDDNPAYLDEAREGGVVAPPIFPVRLFKEPLFGVMTDPELNADLLLLVHGEQEMEFYDVLRPGDLAVLRSEITGIEDKSSGQLLHVGVRLYREGELVVKARSTMFVRDPSAKREKKAKKEQSAEALPAALFTQTLTVTEDQSLRYADASLDNNPIHTDVQVAKMAGLPNIILQGLCTMAFTSQAIVKNAAEGDPKRLRRMSVRFTKPVLPGDKITTEIWADEDSEDGSKSYKFRAINQAGVPVIDNGKACIAD